MEEPQQVLLFWSKNSKYFADLLLEKLKNRDINATPIPIQRKITAEGESQLRFMAGNQTNLFGKDCIYVSSLCSDSDFMELFRVAASLSSFGTRSRIFVIPFLGYSTMERATQFGEVVTCKANIRLLSRLPAFGYGNAFLFLDLHVNGILHYFEGDILRAELYGQETLQKAIGELPFPEGSFMFASADLGRPKWVEAFAKAYKTDIAFVRKTRSFTDTKVMDVIGNVKGKHVIIYDDMTRSGGTLMHAADAYMERGALSVSAVISHLALNDDNVVKKLKKSNIKWIIATNSHPFTQNSCLKTSNELQPSSSSSSSSSPVGSSQFIRPMTRPNKSVSGKAEGEAEGEAKASNEAPAPTDSTASPSTSSASPESPQTSEASPSLSSPSATPLPTECEFRIVDCSDLFAKAIADILLPNLVVPGSDPFGLMSPSPSAATLPLLSPHAQAGSPTSGYYSPTSSSLSLPAGASATQTGISPGPDQPPSPSTFLHPHFQPLLTYYSQQSSSSANPASSASAAADAHSQMNPPHPVESAGAIPSYHLHPPLSSPSAVRHRCSPSPPPPPAHATQPDSSNGIQVGFAQFSSSTNQST
ncbi:Ribose-phosphate diphosphokinase [Monocercomonoides exilis]|uniref:Ribose-phosphate diphosphokinase n=1 Tax=Monocercomonoides exilis TaxID=2049356 RepID=UPI00355A19E0|nr:Ribose-phosphate diphosphokinase [Monocercomonoides exilis]|eukprot:MONOS_16753.1-p1 / transcript=MONOS_16753.1 / gene=MONOS_16753 / organism=Monocercomonoides_exilis_PA203 / gene_product=Ribose-phosphate diphosphokinase [EC:2.7.6.1] / transcript_product=Ribose-phosphate diphosphokinase [EC:2.7.6.1] / location=Mono_scaffold00014:37409-39613(+) / protein_length=589 / sequence_SO=supercontig / SO=protein_coding / is_pseudo=false